MLSSKNVLLYREDRSFIEYMTGLTLIATALLGRASMVKMENALRFTTTSHPVATATSLIQEHISLVAEYMRKVGNGQHASSRSRQRCILPDASTANSVILRLFVVLLLLFAGRQ